MREPQLSTLVEVEDCSDKVTNYWYSHQHELSLCVRKPTILVPTTSDSNRAVKSQKMVKRLEILDLESRGIVLSV